MTTATRTRQLAGTGDGIGQRWFWLTFSAVAGGELLFAVISGLLDGGGTVADIAGHLPTLVALGILISWSQHRALDLPLPVKPALVAGLGTFFSYGLAYAILGPPVDFLLGLVVTGFVTSTILWRSLRRSGVRRFTCIGGIGSAYLVGAIAGVAAAIALGDQVDHAFGSGVPGFTAVVTMIGIVAGAVGGGLSAIPVTRMMRNRVPA